LRKWKESYHSKRDLQPLQKGQDLSFEEESKIMGAEKPGFFLGLGTFWLSNEHLSAAMIVSKPTPESMSLACYVANSLSDEFPSSYINVAVSSNDILNKARQGIIVLLGTNNKDPLLTESKRAAKAIKRGFEEHDR